jgi:hypothetical protein
MGLLATDGWKWSGWIKLAVFFTVFEEKTLIADKLCCLNLI